MNKKIERIMKKTWIILMVVGGMFIGINSCTEEGPTQITNVEYKGKLFLTVSLGNTAGARTDAELATAFQMLSELGAKYAKWNFSWKSIEITPGNYDWTKTDYVATLAQQYNISIIMFCPQVGIPSWELKEGTTNVPKNLENYENFILQVLNRYQTSMNIQYVEVLNEISTGVIDGINPPYCPHWDTTTAYAVEVGNAIYDKVHQSFPGVKVGPASFTQPHALSGSMTSDNEIKDTYFANYFAAAPKMDFLALHNYPHYGSSQTSTFTYADQYNQTSLYRTLLDSYGYQDTPILITEGSLGLGSGVNHELYAAFLAQDFIIQYTKKDSVNLTGMVSATVANELGGTTGYNIVDVTSGEKYAGFYAVKTLMSMLTKYPDYETRVTGQPNSLDCWVEKFKDAEENRLWILFAPTQIIYPNPEQSTPRNYIFTEPQDYILNIGPNKSVVITYSDGSNSTAMSDSNGNLTVTVYKEPVYVEEES